MEGIQLNVTVLLSPKLNKIVYHTLTVRFLHWDLMAWLGDLWVFLWDSQVAQCRRFKRWRFNPCFGKTLWRRKWHHTVVVLPGKSHGQRSLAGYSPWGHKEFRLSTPECSLPSSYGCGLPSPSLHPIHTMHADRTRKSSQRGAQFYSHHI